MADIRFAAYAGDCLVEARLDLGPHGRLTDLLNESTGLQVSHVALISLADGHTVNLDQLDLVADDLLVVEAPAIAGARPQRIHTRAVAVDIVCGPYRVVGRIHGPVSGDPLQQLGRRKRMIPVTGATVSYYLGGRVQTVERDVVIVNRDHIQNVLPVRYQKSMIDDIRLAPVDPRAVDLTGQLTEGLEDSSS